MGFLEDIRSLRTLLDQRHGQEHRDVRLRGASKDVQTFWEIVGWAPFMEGLDLAPPERELGEGLIAATLASWRTLGMSTLTREDLPDDLRLVRPDVAGVGFLIADETTDVSDPPLLAVSCDTNTVTNEQGSYLAFVSRALFGVSSSSVWLRVQPASLLKGHARFPALLPDVVETELGLHVESREGTSAFVANTATEVFDWLRESKVSKVGIDSIGTELFIGSGYAFVRSRLTDVLDLPSWNKSDVLVLGHLGDTQVLVNSGPEGSSVHADCDTETLFYLAHGVAQSRWPVDRGPIAIAPEQSPDPQHLRSALMALDPEHGTLDPTTDTPASLHKFLMTLGRGPLIDDLWPVPGTLTDGPKKSHRLAQTQTWGVFTDEDDPRDDPVAVWRLNDRVVLASARATSFLARHIERTIARRLQVQVNRVLKGVPWQWDVSAPLASLADGVYIAGGIVFARDGDAWLTYLESLDEKVVRGSGPPTWYVQSELQEPSRKDLERIAALGLRRTKRTSQEYLIAGSQYLGRIDGVAVWVSAFDETRAGRKPKKRLRVFVHHAASDRDLMASVFGDLQGQAPTKMWF